MKELNEAFCGLAELGLVVVGEVKDGLQASDVVGIISKVKASPEVSAALVEAVKGIQLVPAEIKGAGLSDWFGLGLTLVKYVPRYLSALKG
jgi:hypothetical protein